MAITLHIVCHADIGYNDSTYDISSGDRILYAGEDEQAARDAIDTAVDGKVSNWHLESFADEHTNGYTSVEHLLRAHHRHTIHQVDEQAGDLRLVFGPVAPIRTTWGDLVSFGRECWAVAPVSDVIAIIVEHRDRYIQNWIQKAAENHTDGRRYSLDPELTVAELATRHAVEALNGNVRTRPHTIENTK